MPETAIDDSLKVGQNQEPTVNIESLDDKKDQTEITTESSQMKISKKQKKKFAIFALVAIVAGVLTGFGSAQLKGATNKLSSTEEKEIVSDTSKINIGDVFGVQDKDTFADSAQGYLEAGGVEGEGSHRLLREGGVTQTVALTSSVADLDDFVGMEIKIWGDTNKAQSSGWFMDVGRVEIIATEAEAPIQSLD